MNHEYTIIHPRSPTALCTNHLRVNIEGWSPAMACKRPDVDLKEAVLAMTVSGDDTGTSTVLSKWLSDSMGR
jgi:hypothetical protein